MPVSQVVHRLSTAYFHRQNAIFAAFVENNTHRTKCGADVRINCNLEGIGIDTHTQKVDNMPSQKWMKKLCGVKWMEVEFCVGPIALETVFR
jgi:hypothetical protein